MSVDERPHDAAVLLEAEHAVARVLTETGDEAAAYPRLLAAIGGALGWDAGAVWTPDGDGAPGSLRCAETWPATGIFQRASHAARLAPGEGLPGRVWASGQPAWIADVRADANFPRSSIAARAGLRAGFCFPIRGATGVLAAMEFLVAEEHEPDGRLLATMTSVGTRIGHCVDRWQAERRLRDSDARKTAILNAALDCIITMDARGVVVEVNEAAERTFRYTAAEMVGRDLAELIIPPALREPHRRGVDRYLTTGHGVMVGHPTELFATRSDGSEFPVEVAVTRPEIAGPPLFTGYIRDLTARKRGEQALRSLAEEQAALRRVATTVAGGAQPERVFDVVTEAVGRLLGAHTSNMVRFEPGGTGRVVGAWSTPEARAVPVGTRVGFDGPTVAARILLTGRPERIETYEGVAGRTAEMLRGIGFRSAVGAPIELAGELWGAVLVSTLEDEPFPAGAEQRVADFAELVALALANAQAREELAASRARIVEAGDAERRRLERNLHDGAQQRLVALSLLLRRAELRLEEGAPEGRELVRRANAELREALDELRELARGIHPAVLTDRGLTPALEMLAGRASIPIELHAALSGRLPDAVEAAVYYLVAEAVTNATKHAGATRVRVDVRREDRHAVVEVADDGAGGADERAGSGLRGLCDRVEALGGVLELSSPRGGGTALRARIPCS